MRYTIEKEMWDSVALKTRWFERYRVLKLFWRGVFIPVVGTMAYGGAFFAPFAVIFSLWMMVWPGDEPVSPQRFWSITIVIAVSVGVLCLFSLRRIAQGLRYQIFDLDLAIATAGLIITLLLMMWMLPYNMPEH